jgi:hypothetical protein
MKAPIFPGSFSDEELQASLSDHFKQYKIKRRSKNFLVVEKSKTTGANVVIKKNRINIMVAFPNPAINTLFALCVFLFGIILPLLFYFIIYYSRQKKVVRETAGFIKTIVTAPESKK